MATRIEFEPDRDGIGEILTDTCRDVIDELTNEIADQARSTVRPEFPIETSYYTTDRAVGSVSITHAAGLAIEAKYGSLTAAAAAVGLEVRS